MLHKNEYKRYAGSKSLMHRPIDQILLLIVLIMVGIGCFFIYDFTAVGAVIPSRSYYLTKQIAYAVGGFCYLWLLSRIDYHYLASLAIPLLIVLVVLHILVFVAGSSGFIQWHAPRLTLGGVAIPIGQATELAGILILAGFLARIDLVGFGKSPGLMGALFLCMLPVTSGNPRAMLVLTITLSILCFLVSKWVVLLYLLGFITVFISFLLMIRTDPSVMSQYNFSAWLDPFSDPQGSGFASVQSIYAIADGGILGVGVGNGTMRYAVEDAHSTFMLPAMAQEIGVFGVVMILLIYLLFLARAFTIAAKAADRFGFYLAAAIIIRYSVLFVFALLTPVNLIPQLGNFTLPFFSYGGSSLFTDLLLVGILISIGRYQTESARR